MLRQWGISSIPKWHSNGAPYEEKEAHQMCEILSEEQLACQDCKSYYSKLKGMQQNGWCALDVPSIGDSTKILFAITNKGSEVFSFYDLKSHP